MSAAGTVTGSWYLVGSSPPGAGFRNRGLRGTPEERVESICSHLLIDAQIPFGSSVYF